MTTRLLGAAVALISVAGLVAAGPAGARPRGPDRPRAVERPNGVTLQRAARLAAGPFGDCAVAGVTCKPTGVNGSCTGYSSQSTPPTSIRVYDPTYTGANHIRTVPFETYVENVLPNEWSSYWDGDALKAGAVAVTSYAWYWVTHYGGYVGDAATSGTCFDVTSDENFQVFRNDSALPNSTAKVQQVFPSAIRVGGAVLQASYVAAVRPGYDISKVSTYDACGQGANGTFLSQSGSQTCNENDTADKWPVILKTYYGQNIQLASTAQLRTQHDFQYLRRSTEATFDAGRWTIDDGYRTAITWGQRGDVPVVNTAGDGFARVGVYRPSNHTWYLANANGTATAHRFTYGLAGDVPVAAQYDGLSSPTQVALFRPSSGTWYLAGPNGGTASTVVYGRRGDIPVPGRWTNASTDSIAVFRPSNGTWYLRGGVTVHYGRKGDIPVPADYNGDGITDIAVFRPSTGQFFVSGHAAVRWGNRGDIPVTGDFTGDGRADIAVYRPSNHTWYVRGGATSAFGATGVLPIGKAPYPG